MCVKVGRWCERCRRELGERGLDILRGHYEGIGRFR